MPSLDVIQTTMMRAIALGPGHVPEGLFRGRHDAALRGLSVHANTISHARLIALEDTFPRTRQFLGEGAFNRLSRAYCDGGHGAAMPLSHIGNQFPAWLDEADVTTVAANLARFEWSWLECYHASGAKAFGMSDLASLSEADIADLTLVRHPASMVLQPEAEVRAMLGEEFGQKFNGPHVLIARSEAEVAVTALSATAARLHASFASAQRICSLLADTPEPDVQDALLALLTAGALTRAIRSC